MKPRPLVYIEWLDACQHAEGVDEEPLMLCRTAGFAHRDKNAIVVSWHIDETGWPENSTAEIAIHTRSITKMVRLVEGEPITLRSIPKRRKET